MVSASDLTRVRDESGDELYYDQITKNGRQQNIIYILKDGDTSNTPLKVTDEYGNDLSLYTEYSSDDGYISNYKAYAVEETTNGYVLAIKSENGYEGSLNTSWTIYDVSPSGVIDYGSYTNNIID